MTQWIEAGAVAGLLKPGMTVFVAGATAEPRQILESLSKAGERCAGVRFVSVSLPDINGGDFSRFDPEARSTVFFATAENRAGIAAGQVDFLPMQYRAIYAFLETELQIDLVLVQLPEPGGDGRVSLGIAVDFLPAVLNKATLLVAEINSKQPTPRDAPDFPVSRLDYAVACNRPVPTLPSIALSDSARAIGQQVSTLVADGDCLQIGIGAIPDATLAALTEKNDLGIHSGMITDGVMALAKSGNINGHNKAIDRDQIVSGVVLGSQGLIDWAGDESALSLRPVAYTHDPAVIRQIDNFVSINSALEIDLYGQVNADMLGPRQISGTGGCVDMMRGAALSKGGRSIIALASTANQGQVSRIVPTLAAHTATTALRTDIDIVVTEHGARRLKHLPVLARAEALIELADPRFRDGLREQWNTLKRA